MSINEGQDKQKNHACKKWYRVILRNFTEANILHAFFSSRRIVHFFYEIGAQKKVAFEATNKQRRELMRLMKIF